MARRRSSTSPRGTTTGPTAAARSATPPTRSRRRRRTARSARPPARSSASSTRRSASGVAVAGTPFELYYSSGRVPGYKEAYRLDIPLTGRSDQAESLRRVELEVTVAGREFRQTFAARRRTSRTRSSGTARTPTAATVEGAQTAERADRLRLPRRVPRAGRVRGVSFGQFGGAPVTRNERRRRRDAPRDHRLAGVGAPRRRRSAPARTRSAAGRSTSTTPTTRRRARSTSATARSVTTEAIRSEIRTVVGCDPFGFETGDTDGHADPTSTLVRGIDVGADGSDLRRRDRRRPGP